MGPFETKPALDPTHIQSMQQFAGTPQNAGGGAGSLPGMAGGAMGGLSFGMVPSIMANKNMDTGMKLGVSAISAFPVVGGLAASLIMSNEDRIAAEKKAKEDELNAKKQEAYTRTMNNVAGAQMTKPTFRDGGELTSFEGASHENGGIDIGVAEVEGGETMKDRYVYSDTTLVDDEIVSMDKSLIPYKGMTIAAATKKIEKEYGLRSKDPYDSKLKDKLMEYLKLGQEVKRINGKVETINKETKQKFNKEKRKMRDGGGLPEGTSYEDFYAYLSSKGYDDAKITKMVNGRDNWGKSHNKVANDEGYYDYYDSLVSNTANPTSQSISGDVTNPGWGAGTGSGDIATQMPFGYNAPYQNVITPEETSRGVLRLPTNNTKVNGTETDWRSVVEDGVSKEYNSNVGDPGDRSSTDGLVDRVKNSKQYTEFNDPWNKLKRQANMGNYFDIARGIHGLTKDEKEFDRADAMQASPSYLDPTREIQDVNMGYSSAERAVAGQSSGIGNYIANRLGLASSRAKSISGVENRYATQNAQIGNQFSMFNAGQREKAMMTNLDQQRYQEDINQKERDVAANMIQGGLSNRAENLMSLNRDKQYTERDANIARQMEEYGFKFDENGKVIRVG